jgi:hypothetical protein
MHRAALDLAGRSLPMITIHVEKRYGSSTVRSCVTAPTIEQALLLAGEGARVVFPIDGETFFASTNFHQLPLFTVGRLADAPTSPGELGCAVSP